MEKDDIKDLRQFKKQTLVFSNGDTPTQAGRSTGKIETKNTIHSVNFIFRKAADVGMSETEIATDVDTIVIRAEGKVIREYTAQQIMDLYQHNMNDLGAHTVEGVVSVPFAENVMDISELNNSYAFGMVYKGKPIAMTYEINYKNVVPTALKVEVRVVVDDRVQELGQHKRIMPHIRAFASTGPQDITDLPKGKGTSHLLGYHFVLGAGVISQITVKGDDTIYDQLPRELLELMLNNAGRKVQSGYFHLPFNLDNDPRSVQVLNQNTAQWLVQPYWSTSPAGSYTILEERVHFGLD